MSNLSKKLIRQQIIVYWKFANPKNLANPKDLIDYLLYL